MKKGNDGMSFVGIDEINKLFLERENYKREIELSILHKTLEIEKKLNIQLEPLDAKLHLYDLRSYPHGGADNMRASIFSKDYEGSIQIVNYKIMRVTLKHENLDEILKVVNEFLDELKESDK